LFDLSFLVDMAAKNDGEKTQKHELLRKLAEAVSKLDSTRRHYSAISTSHTNEAQAAMMMVATPPVILMPRCQCTGS
jgi:hypothetical protein